MIFRSGYHPLRNWIQISLMGECSRERLEPLLTAMRTDVRGRNGRPDDARMLTDREVPRRASAV